jgi:hypothetical protein
MDIIAAGCVVLFIALFLLLPRDDDWYDGASL